MEGFPRNQGEFDAAFGSEEACWAYLVRLRWPEGFRCPGCGHDKAWPVRGRLFQCAACGRQASVTAGTIFQDTRTPLTVWFRAMWAVTSQKTGTSALALQQVLGFGSYQTAWAWLHKLRRAMVRPGRDRLAGRVEVDETFVGGLEDGISGRGAVKKVLIASPARPPRAGVETVRRQSSSSGRSLAIWTATNGGKEAEAAMEADRCGAQAVRPRDAVRCGGRPRGRIAVAAEDVGRGIGRIRLRRVPNASANSLQGFIDDVVEPGSEVHTDGWVGYDRVEAHGYRHRITFISDHPEPANKLLPRVHLVVSLLKRWLLGTHQGAVSPAHLDYYLDEFTFRFNRRRSRYRGKLFHRLAQQAVQVPPVPYKDLVKHAGRGRRRHHKM